MRSTQDQETRSDAPRLWARRVSIAALVAVTCVGVLGLGVRSPVGHAEGSEAHCETCAGVAVSPAALPPGGAPVTGSGTPWLFDTTGFPARWNCGEWSSALGWTHIIGDLAIWGAYMAVPVALAIFVIRRRSPLPTVTWLFVAFIGACGLGHLLEAVIFWHPVYRLAGAWKVVTAAVSWATVVALVPVVPRALRLPTLEETNRRLEHEAGLRAEVERELRSANRMLGFQKRALDEHSIVAITDERGVITYVNEKFCRISGYDESELVGKTHRVVNSGVHPEAFFVEMWRTIVGGEVWKGEICNRAKDGRLYWVDTTIVPFKDESGRPTKYVAIRTDISARKRFEARLASTVESLRTKGSELDRKNQELEQFTYSASHDLKSPLVTILGYCDCIAEDIEHKRYDSLEQYAGRIIHNAMRMRASIDDLLALSRIGKIDEQIEGIDLEDLADEVLEIYAQRLADSGVRVVRSFGAREIHGVRERVRQVLQNLIGNALDHGSGARPMVEIGSSEEDGSTVLWVRDNGPGIAPAYHQSVFELYKRLKPGTAGTGVGLAIVKRVAEIHGGRAWVESSPGEGAKFLVSFPVAHLARGPHEQD